MAVISYLGEVLMVVDENTRLFRLPMESEVGVSGFVETDDPYKWSLLLAKSSLAACSFWIGDGATSPRRSESMSLELISRYIPRIRQTLLGSGK